MAITYEPIVSTTISTTTNTVTFSSLPQTYTDLRLVVTGGTTPASNVFLYANNDTGANYRQVRLSSTNGGTPSTTASSYNHVYLTITAAMSDTTTVSRIVDIFSYTNNKPKNFLVNETNKLPSGGNVTYSASQWTNTSAINRLDLTVGGSNSFTTGTVISIYGIQAA